MRLARLVAVSPEVAFGLLHTLVWLLLALGVSAGVLAPLAQGLAATPVQ
jgi:hypothetical protein